jgi:hypothetical protein
VLDLHEWSANASRETRCYEHDPRCDPLEQWADSSLSPGSMPEGLVPGSGTNFAKGSTIEVVLEKIMTA